MSREGYMSPDDAERAVWAFYWQLYHSRDRRTAPIRSEPGDTLSEEERHELRQREEQQIGLWSKVQKQVSRWFTTSKQEDHYKGITDDLRGQVAADADLSGVLHAGTGLPQTANDLASGRGIVSGAQLCLGAIIPPEDLAAATTTWLPPCPMDENSETWGNELEHWQALAYKPKEIPCPDCQGRGKVQTLFKGNPILVTCGVCGGKGSKPNWKPEEFEAVEANAFQIKRKIHELAERGYFDKRPINPNDREMSDLVWEDEAGFTIGFKLTYEGLQRMLEYCDQVPELQQKLHVLQYAGEELRREAPDWAQKEFKARPQVSINSDLGASQTPDLSSPTQTPDL